MKNGICRYLLVVVVLGGLAVCVCRKRPESSRYEKVAMSAQQVEMIDLVDTYLFDDTGSNSDSTYRDLVGPDVWVEGIMTGEGPWPFRVVRIDSIFGVVSVGAGALDVNTWTVTYVEPVANQTGTKDLEGFHGFTLPFWEVAVVLDSTGSTQERAAAVLRRAFTRKGWIGEDDVLTCIWFAEEDTNGWVAYHVLTASWYASKHDHILLTNGRVNLKTREVELDPFSTM
ncbi:MAG: hypothetical protein ACYTAN_06195 [Planctomycetota bacterium]|jgi:hypothetical protein